jgi:hypothetical protein
MEDTLFSLFPAQAAQLLRIKGTHVLDKVGAQTICKLVVDIMGGTNVRAATESLTRRRLAHLNAALFMMLVKATAQNSDLTGVFTDLVKDQYFAKGTPATEKAVLEWLVGLNGKAFQNVLRSNRENWDEYSGQLRAALDEVKQTLSESYEPLQGSLQIGETQIEVDWPLLLLLFTGIGAQTLAIRGSEKSLYGKLFEKLVLGSLLSLLGFRFAPEIDGIPNEAMLFTLSNRKARREVDASAWIRPDLVVRFDMGFIGKGNPEIARDKLSRYERALEIHGHTVRSHTMILVDQVGAGSEINNHAAELGVSIVEMSKRDWPRDVSRAFEKQVGEYTDRISALSDEDLKRAIERSVQSALEEIFTDAVKDAALDVTDVAGEEEDEATMLCENA